MFESRIETITEVQWKGEDEALIKCGCSCWAGSKRKDFWGSDEPWESLIVPGIRIRYWTVSYSIILGFEVELDGKWVSVWCKANDFQTKAKREASSKAYGDFIEAEGKKIAQAIDDGKNLAEIDKIIDDGHTGNTYGCALHFGICNATNKANADVVRKEHNAKHGVGPEKKGTVNPAILTIG